MIVKEERRRCDICRRAARRLFQAEVHIVYRKYADAQLLLEPQPEETVVIDAKLDLCTQHRDRLIKAANRSTKPPDEAGT